MKRDVFRADLKQTTGGHILALIVNLFGSWSVRPPDRLVACNMRFARQSDGQNPRQSVKFEQSVVYDLGRISLSNT